MRLLRTRQRTRSPPATAQMQKRSRNSAFGGAARTKTPSAAAADEAEDLCATVGIGTRPGARACAVTTRYPREAPASGSFVFMARKTSSAFAQYGG